MTHDEKIRRIAAGSPWPLPHALTADAMAGLMTVEDFAVAAAEHCIRAAEAEQRAREILEA